MKKASTIFAIIGIVINVLYSAFSILLNQNNELTAFTLMTAIPTIVLTLGFGILVLKSLKKNEKKTWLGVVAILFVNILCGIFYLCWKPENKEQVQPSTYDIEDHLE